MIVPTTVGNVALPSAMGLNRIENLNKKGRNEEEKF
jgi:hypothetical protein